MEQENTFQLNLSVVALVALVAIVGMVTLVANRPVSALQTADRSAESSVDKELNVYGSAISETCRDNLHKYCDGAGDIRTCVKTWMEDIGCD